MNAKTFLLVAVVLGALALGVAWKEANRARETGAAVAALLQKRVVTGAQLKRSEEDLALVQGKQGDLRRTLETIEKTPPVSPAQTVSPPRSPPPPTPLDAIHQDPKLQVLWLASRRAIVAENYGPLFHSLGLAPEQIAKFQDIAIRREEKNMDLSGVMRAQGLSPQDPLVAKLQRDADAEYEAAQNELLGSSGFRQLHDYERLMPARDVVSGLAGAAAVAGVPLTAQQADQITQLLATSSGQYQNGGAVDLGTVDWKAADDRAQAILSGPQFALFQHAEPERGNNLRFGTQMGTVLLQARQADAASRSTAQAAPPGGR